MTLDPYRPADDEARALAADLLQTARHAALAVTLDDGAPMVTRVAFGLDPRGVPVTLISALSQHTNALQQRPVASLLVGEPAATGDPLTHPRLTLQVLARFFPHDDPDRPALRRKWLADHPKSKLYIDFADFSFVRLSARSAILNGGFGKAYRLTDNDLTPEP
jgi:heme iron utilization protein